MTKVDVVVPCYNYGRFLEQCVRSVLEQSVGDLRLLIIDDASSDDSVSVAKRLANSDARVSIIAHSENQGHISTYNEGIAWASADYFLLLSADDLLVPGAFERATAVMDANPDVVLTHGDAIYWYDGEPIPKIDAQPGYTWVRQDLVREMCAIGQNFVRTPTAIGRTIVQKKIGGYRASLPHSGDMEMWLRFGAHGAVARISAVQAIYRKHFSTMSKSYSDESDLLQRQAAFDCFFEDYKDRIPAYQKQQAQANRKVAQEAFRAGVDMLRSGIRLSQRARIIKGIHLIHWSMQLSPSLRYCPPIWYLLRIPGRDRRKWLASFVTGAARKLRQSRISE
jgi:glycosyltransferase involved in cell wall biosynthesis